MNLKTNFHLMADYNHWMNQNIYQQAARLSTEELTADRGAFFGSILGTLNHIVVADIIWLQRFEHYPLPLRSLDPVLQLPRPESLDQILHVELEPLTARRGMLDQAIIAFIDEIPEQGLSLPLAYRNMKGEMQKKIVGQLLQHFFNHQTHHRGQATTLFNQLGIDVGVTDVLVRIPNL